ncbi:tripartite tricarboxylate transporter substrate binding protein [Hydrogenophaga sp.]|uniref:Bug family tripartite tricarboxylate transporter substrate binding protein n=1 Tax=Hydrogenophaga sp. TaxID=1904254 RepID=UPI0027220971|nr:tripartite tricarboxylate transporter substrate binding protein [Hydrogenophaga sp.]MDO9437659.1 tripartite tricarboxylate transporter substrate binding protein [Hydrogenophaga sp.]
MIKTNPLFRLLLALLLAALMPWTAVHAQSYPSKPIRFIYPYPAGGSGDNIMRLVAEMLGPELGGTVYVDNRPGASGVVGSRTVAESPPDGYTIGLTSNGTHAAVMSLVKNPGYDPLKNFTHLGLFASLPWMLVVPVQLPFQSVNDLVTWARANPGKLTMSHYSSSSRVLVHMLQSAGKLQLTEVPYKAPGQVINDLYGGQLQAAFLPMEIAMAQAAGGKVRVLGSASEKRLPGAPQVPTIAEQLPGVAMTSWMGMGAPVGLPPDVSAKLQAALTRVVNKPEFRERLQKIGGDVLINTPEQIDVRIRDEMVLWAKFAKDAGVQPE